jgi:hypothetical protein
MAFVYIVMNAADNNAIQEVFTSLNEAEVYCNKWNKAHTEDHFWWDDWQVDL